jgi:pre-mRNA-processing factor 19
MASHTPISLEFYTLDVFTTTKYRGNPLAVVLVPPKHRAALTQDRKQLIAREFNLSETVFMHGQAEEDDSITSRDIDIFLIDQEITFAGHPTIGSAYLALHHLRWNRVNTLIAKAGPIGVAPAGEGGVRAEIPQAVHVHQKTLGHALSEHHPEYRNLSTVSSIRTAQLRSPIVSIVRGMTFALVKLSSLEELAQVAKGPAVHYAEIQGLLDVGEWAKSFVSTYYYVDLGFDGGQLGHRRRRLRTRSVEQHLEDPATGSAACTLTAYLALSEAVSASEAHSDGQKEELSFEITQGVEMGRKSDIAVDIVMEEVGHAVKHIYLGGSAVVVMQGTIEV